MDLLLRKACLSDLPALEQLIDASVRGLQQQDYTPAQIEAALRTAFTVDTQLIEDGTYFIAHLGAELAGCGGWSWRKTLCGGSHHVERDSSPLDPACDPAKIRAIFVHPRYARRGVGSMILKAAEEAASAAGFTRFEMGATLTGVPLYGLKGYSITEIMEVPLDHDLTMTVARMRK